MSNIGKVGLPQVYSAHAGRHVKAKAKEEKEVTQNQEAVTAEQDTQDVVKEKAVVNSAQKTYSPDTVMMNYLKSVTENNAKTLREMIEKLMSSQGYMAKGQFRMSMQVWGSLEDDKERMLSFDFSMDFELNFEFGFATNDEVRAQAAALIADDGPLGVKQVSENILKFAKAISGGDPSKIDMLWDAAIKGFNQVAELFGGLENMPEVSRRTYEAINQGFAAWKAEAEAEAETDPVSAPAVEK